MSIDNIVFINNLPSLDLHGFTKDFAIIAINEFIKDGELGLVIVDEIHKAKNPTSMQGRGLLKIKGCQKIGLSGTLLVNKPMDLYMHPDRFRWTRLQEKW